MRACLLSLDHSKEVAERTFRRVCENRGNDVSSSIANTKSDSIIPETQTMMAGDEKEEILLGELKFSEQADVICLHSQLSKGRRAK